MYALKCTPAVLFVFDDLDSVTSGTVAENGEKQHFVIPVSAVEDGCIVRVMVSGNVFIVVVIVVVGIFVLKVIRFVNAGSVFDVPLIVAGDVAVVLMITILMASSTVFICDVDDAVTSGSVAATTVDAIGAAEANRGQRNTLSVFISVSARIASGRAAVGKGVVVAGATYCACAV